jgi:peptide/nickel transport system ATP-binding protein
MSEYRPQMKCRDTDRQPIMEVRGLKKHYPITEGVMKREVGRVKAVDGISFNIAPGETLGLVGESGCGKSTAATSLLRIEEPTDGEVFFDGDDITGYDKAELKHFRRRAQMIFQNPDSSFDPRMSIGESVAEPLRIHGVGPREYRRAIVKDLLEHVGLNATDIDRYPHEFSGGQKQRIALARALVVNPDLIVADEPVSALDVSIQAEILTLMEDIQQKFDVSILFISHDMSIIRQVCDHVAVMYLGEIVEISPTKKLFSDPQHPYTRALLASIPVPDPHQHGDGTELTGDVPDPSNPPTGCRFHTRCPEVIGPEDYAFEQDEWRSVLDLRNRLSRGQVDIDAIRELLVTEDAVESTERVTDEQLRTVLREEYNIPEQLSDTCAESVLSDALDRIVAGDPDAANERLASEFATVCEQRHPELQATETGHPAACHLHDQSAIQDTVESAASPED